MGKHTNSKYKFNRHVCKVPVFPLGVLVVSVFVCLIKVYFMMVFIDNDDTWNSVREMSYDPKYIF
jgi:hypothetical protein